MEEQHSVLQDLCAKDCFLQPLSATPVVHQTCNITTQAALTHLPTSLYLQDLSGLVDLSSPAPAAATKSQLRQAGEIEALLRAPENVPADALSLEQLAALLESLELRQGLHKGGAVAAVRSTSNGGA